MTITVASFGGGTDSTAMLIGMWEKGEKVDLILFADTGGEKPHTYDHIKRFSEWLVKNGMPEITVVRYKKETLEENCLRIKSLPSIAYGFKKCSLKFKVQPQDQFVNNWQPAKDAWARGEKVIKLIGYDASEGRRAERKSSPINEKKYQFRYPLIEWGWDRATCIDVIKSQQVKCQTCDGSGMIFDLHAALTGDEDCPRCRGKGYEFGFPLPGKSACFFCPSSKAQEVKQLAKQYPDLAARAVVMEKNAILTDIKGLGRDYSWAEMLKFDEAQTKLFDSDWSTAEVPCGCFE